MKTANYLKHGNHSDSTDRSWAGYRRYGKQSSQIYELVMDIKIYSE
jgi:hypothetical protein